MISEELQKEVDAIYELTSIKISAKYAEEIDKYIVVYEVDNDVEYQVEFPDYDLDSYSTESDAIEQAIKFIKFNIIENEL